MLKLKMGGLACVNVRHWFNIAPLTIEVMNINPHSRS